MEVFEFLRPKTKAIICSYLHKEECGIINLNDRMSSGFLNHYSIGEFTELLRCANYTRKETNYWHGHRLYMFT